MAILIFIILLMILSNFFHWDDELILYTLCLAMGLSMYWKGWKVLPTILTVLGVFGFIAHFFLA